MKKTNTIQCEKYKQKAEDSGANSHLAAGFSFVKFTEMSDLVEGSEKLSMYNVSVLPSVVMIKSL